MAATMCLPANVAESTLVGAAGCGDRNAFGELYRRYARMVHGILLAGVPPDDVDDLMHDVFLTAMDRLPYLRNSEAFGGWLAAIARRRAIDHHRACRNHSELVDNAAAPGPSAEDRVEALRILKRIRELPEAYRETLVLRLVEGLTGPEIAQRAGLSPGSVRVNLCRGMKMLREKLGRSCPE